MTSLQARNIETEFSRWELLKRAFVITSVNIAELKLHLAPVSFRFREKPEGPRSWAEENILPDTCRLEKGSIDSLSVSYGEAGRLYVLDGARVESAYDAGSNNNGSASMMMVGAKCFWRVEKECGVQLMVVPIGSPRRARVMLPLSLIHI